MADGRDEQVRRVAGRESTMKHIPTEEELTEFSRIITPINAMPQWFQEENLSVSQVIADSVETVEGVYREIPIEEVEAIRKMMAMFAGIGYWMGFALGVHAERSGWETDSPVR